MFLDAAMSTNVEEITAMNGKRDRLITRELLDCYRRDIYSSNSFFSNQAIQSLKETIERGGDFDCEATRINALDLYCAVATNG